jgi:hypothetical protein
MYNTRHGDDRRRRRREPVEVKSKRLFPSVAMLVIYGCVDVRQWLEFEQNDPSEKDAACVSIEDSL